MLKVTGHITRTVRELCKAEDVSVCLTPGFVKTVLSVTENGDIRMLPISRKVAEVLIAQGFAYQG